MKRIAASLRYGKLLKKTAIFFVVGIVISIVILIVTFNLLFQLILNGNDDVSGTILAIIGGLCLGGGYLWFCSYLLVNDVINVKKCKEWLKDAVELDAYCEGIRDENTNILLRKFCLKLKVYFKYNDKKLIRYSLTKHNDGYDICLYKYANKDLKILYSPKYDEVMIPTQKLKK